MHRNIFLQRTVFFFTMAILLIMPISCFRNYYKISKRPVTASETDINSLKSESRYFVLRVGDGAWHMNNIRLSADQSTIHCELKDLPFSHQLHLRHGEHENMQYRATKSTRSVLSEVHLYIPYDSAARPGVYNFAADKVSNIEIIEKDVLRSVGSHVGGVIAVAGSIAAGALLFAALTSCPFVSPYDGTQFSMQGEIYGGAVYPQLSRHDYFRLNMAPTPGGNLQLKISNELKEVQHTDLAELITVTHSKNVSILHDPDGTIYSIKDPVAPISATTKNNTDVTLLLTSKDERFVAMNDSLSTDGNNEITLNFKKSIATNKAKLILRVKNTFWLDKLYGKMLEGFGNYYNTFVNGQKKKSAEELNKWITDQMIPLKVSLKTKDGWTTITSLKTSGPIAYRDVVVPLDLSSSQESFTQIKLSSGFMFWELDYAAVDESANEIVNIETQQPLSAIDEAGNNVSNALAAADGNYLVQPVPGNVTTVTYNYHAPLEGQTNTYILHSRGWYETIRDFKGKPDLAFLDQFKKPGGLSKFSVEMYRKEKSIIETTAKN